MPQSLSDIVELETPNGRTVRVRAVTHPRARRLSLTIGAGGPRVSAPEGTHPATVRAFLREHAGWLQKKLRELEMTGRKLAPPVPGRAETFTFRGVQLPVIWQQDRFPRIAVAPGRLDFSLDLGHEEALRIAQRTMRAFLLREMRREVARLSAYFALKIGKQPSALRFQPMRTLWGSLSADGRMNLDLALMLAPPEALEYVVVHEMSHLWVRNHGPRFWARVAAVDPDFEAQRDWLNRYGHAVKHELSRWIGEDID